VIRAYRRCHPRSLKVGSNFEAVDATVLRISPDSGAAIQSGAAVTVTPSSASVHVARFQSFSAAVDGAQGGVTWAVNDVPGGNTVVGTIDNSGLYLAPTAAPSPNVVTVRATSVTTPTAGGNTSVTILPAPAITSLSPSPLTTGAFTLTVNGTNFVAGATVTFDGSPLNTTFVSPTKLTATGTANTAKSGAQVTTTMPDGAVSNTALIDIIAPAPVSITISPVTASRRVRQTLQFTASVQGTSNTTVTWKVNGIAGGNATVGTVSQTGLYRAPNSVPQPANVSVSATSNADPTKTATASVGITRK
jgi:hypothetical protein